MKGIILMSLTVSLGCTPATRPIDILGPTPIFMGLNQQAFVDEPGWTTFLAEMDLARSHGVTLFDIMLASRSAVNLANVHSRLGSRKVKLLIRFDIEAADATLSDAWLARQVTNVQQMVTDVNANMPGRVIGYRPVSLTDGEWFLRPVDPAITAARVAYVQCTLAAAIKSSAGRNMLVGFNAGYLFALAYLQGSTHLAFQTVLNSPDIDYIVGPSDYQYSRLLNAPFLPQGPIQSATAHGKLWITEDDTRTSLAASDAFKFSTNSADDVALMTRNVTAAIKHGSGLYVFDLPNGGWFQSEAIWAAIDAAKAATHPATFTNLVLIDDTTLGSQTIAFGVTQLAVNNQGSNVHYGLVSDVNSGLINLSNFTSVVILNP